MDDIDFRDRLGAMISPYVPLLAGFLIGEFDADAFQSRFLEQYLSDETLPDDDIFDVFDRYFSDVESFCGQPRLRDAKDLDEQQLLESTRALLERAGVHVSTKA